MTTLDLLVFAHVAGAIAWVGSGTVLQVLGARVLKSGGGEEKQRFIGDVVYLSTRWFIPIGLFTVAFGIATALDASYSFGDFWITAGLTMFVVSFLVGALYLGPQSERIAKIGESEGVESAAYAINIKRLMVVSRAELFLLWATVFVMVVRPG